jgi:hypothetical protein
MGPRSRPLTCSKPHLVVRTHMCVHLVPLVHLVYPYLAVTMWVPTLGCHNVGPTLACRHAVYVPILACHRHAYRHLSHGLTNLLVNPYSRTAVQPSSHHVNHWHKHANAGTCGPARALHSHVHQKRSASPGRSRGQRPEAHLYCAHPSSK